MLTQRIAGMPVLTNNRPQRESLEKMNNQPSFGMNVTSSVKGFKALKFFDHVQNKKISYIQQLVEDNAALGGSLDVTSAKIKITGDAPFVGEYAISRADYEDSSYIYPEFSLYAPKESKLNIFNAIKKGVQGLKDLESFKQFVKDVNESRGTKIDIDKLPTETAIQKMDVLKQRIIDLADTLSSHPRKNELKANISGGYIDEANPVGEAMLHLSNNKGMTYSGRLRDYTSLTKYEFKASIKPYLDELAK